MTKASGPPPMMKSRVYFDNPDNTSSLWIDERDGKGVMLAYDHDKKTDEILLSQSGLKIRCVGWMPSILFTELIIARNLPTISSTPKVASRKKYAT